MSLSIGIVGLPNVGKSTLFNALTKKSVPPHLCEDYRNQITGRCDRCGGVPAENYPFCTIDPSVGIVPVPDERVNKLSTLSKSAKTIPAVIEFVDIAGLVAGASEGEGLGNKFLTNIREVDAILHVVRMFQDDSVIHVANKVNPMSDIGVINLELILADLEVVSKRIMGLAKNVKRGDQNAFLEENILRKLEKILSEGKMALDVSLNEDEKLKIKSLNLLTLKPMLYVLNISEANENAEVVLTPGVKVDPIFEKGFDDLIKKSYQLLNLETFFTTGEDETRAWTIKAGSVAPEAGVAIHTDFRDKFIRAEVVACEKLLEAGSYGKAREKGWVRTEGKEYVVKDGDVIEFLI